MIRLVIQGAHDQPVSSAKHIDGLSIVVVPIGKTQRRNAKREALVRTLATMPDSYFTKFIEPQFLPAALGGRIRIGTLAGYRAQESAVGRLSDGGDGTLRMATRDTVRGTFQIGNLQMVNSAIVNPGFPNVRTISVNQRFDAWCFCAMIGAYDRQRHLALMAAGNQSLTAYVVYHHRAFLKAIRKLQLYVNYDEPHEYAACAVSYDRPDEVLVSGESIVGEITVADSHLGVFSKPASFGHELEVRFVMRAPDRRNITPILTASLPLRIQRRFRQAIASYGTINP